MSSPRSGFGLIELMVALALGMLVVLGMTQLFASSREAYLGQQSSAMLQEDARFVLSKITQDIRQAGMLGCLAVAAIDNAPVAFDRPISWEAAGSAKSLTLVTANVGDGVGRPDWTVLSDCKEAARAYAGTPPGAEPGQLRFGIRQLTYTYESGQLKISTPAAPARAVLMDNVRAFDVSFGMAATSASTVVERYDSHPADESLIRSVRILMTLQDPAGRVKDQTYSVVAALRNRLG